MSESWRQRSRRLLLIELSVLTLAVAPTTTRQSFATDADQGKALAKRGALPATSWNVNRQAQQILRRHLRRLRGCQISTKISLAFLLLLPHLSMPTVSLNRSEVADLADYIATLK